MKRECSQNGGAKRPGDVAGDIRRVGARSVMRQWRVTAERRGDDFDTDAVGGESCDEVEGKVSGKLLFKAPLKCSCFGSGLKQKRCGLF